MTTPRSRPRSRWYPSRLLDFYASVIVSLRWLVVLFWIAAVAAALYYLPPMGQGGNDLEKLVSTDNVAIQSEVRSFERFGFPLLSRVAVVQRNPEGIPAEVQAKALVRARDVSEGKLADSGEILAAIPLANTLKVVPGSKEDGTTIITLLFTAPDVAFADQLEAARDFVAKHYGPEDSVVGVTGSVPARVEQGNIVLSHLTWLEIATVVAVFLIVAVAFRSLVAPLVALGVAGVAIVLTLQIGGFLAQRLGVPVPQETQPLVVALLLGVVTDYVVFYLSAVRGELVEGSSKREATIWATAKFTPIIVVAGVTAAAGTGALIVAGSPTFRAFGPGMGLAVLIGVVVAVTLVPALLAILGRRAMWTPGRFARRTHQEATSGRFARTLTQPLVAFVVLLGCVGGLLYAAVPLRNMSLGVSFVEALPADNPTRVAAAQAQTGFADGILSPTELMLEGGGVANKQAELAKLQEALGKVPGVAAIVGAGNDIIPEARQLFATADGEAARYLLVFEHEPLGSKAIDTLARIETELPGALKAAGLEGVRTSIGGDTAVAKVVVDQTMQDLGRIAAAALAANFFFLMLYLRAFVAPLALLACSVLAIGAALGLTTRFFGGELTFYVPFAAAVLLVSLGSDYNIFGVGPAWKEARHRPLREALAITLPESARAIRTAAITLAVSFGLLAVVPLRPFRELAFALAIGILIDAFIVRSLLAPALLTLMGEVGEWRNKRSLRRDRENPATLSTPDTQEARG